MDIKNILIWLGGLVASTYLVSVITSVIGSFIWEYIGSKLPKIKYFNASRVNGFWIGAIKGQSGIIPSQAINLYRISDFHGNINVYIEHYKKIFDYTLKLRGCGIYVPPQLSIAYQFDSSKLQQSGTLTARLLNRANRDGRLELLATFSQYIEKNINDTSHVVFISEEYVLRKINLNWRRKLRYVFKKQYSHTSMRSFFSLFFSKRPSLNR